MVVVTRVGNGGWQWQAGDAIVFDDRMLHRGLANTSTVSPDQRDDTQVD